MSNLFIILLLILPIVIVSVLMNLSHKRNKKRNEEGYLKYVNEIKNETGHITGFQKHLVNQLVVLDEVQKKLLVIDRLDGQYSHSLINLKEVKNCTIKQNSETVTPDKKSNKTETIITRSGLELITSGKNQTNKLLVFFDHIAHNFMLKAEKEKEALDFRERIMKLINL